MFQALFTTEAVIALKTLTALEIVPELDDSIFVPIHVVKL